MRCTPEGFGDFTLIELLNADRPQWHAQAACREYPHVNWFTERGEPTEPAKTICRSCPVRSECAAVGAGEQSGIWGGMSGRERRRKSANPDAQFDRLKARRATA